MINDKKKLTKKVLEKYPDTCGDRQTGNFLNAVVLELFDNNIVDFNTFNSESYVRSRRLVLNENPSMDKRTAITKECADMVSQEIIGDTL
jgi:hypothetical protein